MIPKASQRAGGQQLATHLLNEFDNDRVQIAEVRGAMAHDLHGAFAEWRAQSGATKCQKYLYSLSVNPDPEQGPLTRDQYLEFIDRAEKKLGLDGQPRAVVFHVKHGREHCHAVWSRIDLDHMRAVQLSHDRPKLQAVVRDFARDHGLELPAGTRNKETDRYARRRQRENLQEKQQEERTGITKAERMREITAAWRESADARSLVMTLEARGYYLARGDRRSYVVIDRFGEVHSLARYVEGVRTPAIRERLAKDFPLERLPDPAHAKEFARRKREAQLKFQREFVRAAESRRTALAEAHRRRRALLEKRRTALKAQHRAERQALREAHEDMNRGVAATRLIRRPRGVIALLARVTGIQAVINFRQRKQDRARAAEQQRQTEALRRRHDRELHDLKRLERALASIEKRELRSLATALRREHLLAHTREPEKNPALSPDRVAGERPPVEQSPAGGVADSKGGSTDSGDADAGGGSVPPGLKELAARRRRQRERNKSRARRSDKDPRR